MKSKLKCIKFIALFITFIMLFTAMPLTIFAEDTSVTEAYNDTTTPNGPEWGVIPKDEIEDTKVLGEIVSRREENVKHFDIGNGMYQAVTYGTAVHRKDSNGVWQDIDNRLLPDAQNNTYSTSDGPKYRLQRIPPSL